MVKQCHLDLSDFDSVTSNFHLEVFASKVQKAAVWQHAPQISSTIDALTPCPESAKNAKLARSGLRHQGKIGAGLRFHRSTGVKYILDIIGNNISLSSTR
jgi:hypothetical protein